MRKILMIALLALVTVAFYSCSKDGKAPKSLESTSWSSTDEDGETIIQFTSKTAVLVKSINTEDEEFSISGTYTYSAPNVAITIEDETANGVVEGNKMTITDPDDGTSRVFTKK